MISSALRQAVLVAAIGLFTAPAALVRAEEPNPAALAKALQGTTVTLQDGLKASEREGKPISGKFEIEDDALQLSVYTTKGDDFIVVVADPTGDIARAEKITDADDLKAAAAQKAAMAQATVSLLSAADTAVKSSAGLRAVSIYPELQNGHAVAQVTLLQGTVFKKVTEKLD